MKYILFQLVVLHGALIMAFGDGGRERGLAGATVADGRKNGDGSPASGAGFSGAGGPPADLFPSCAVSFLQYFLDETLLTTRRTTAFRNSIRQIKSAEPAISKTRSAYATTRKCRREQIAVFQALAMPRTKQKHKNSSKANVVLLV